MPPLHRRREATPDIHGGGLQRAVRLLGGVEDDDLRTGFELALVARGIGHNRRAGRHDDLLLVGLVARLVLDGDHLPVDTRDRGFHRGVGHGAVGLKIPWPVTFTGPTLRLGEDMDRHRALAAIRLWHRRHADKRVGLDVLERGLHEAHHAHIVRGLDLEFGTVTRLDGQRVAIDLLDDAAHAYRRRVLRPGDAGTGDRSGGKRPRRDARNFPVHDVLPYFERALASATPPNSHQNTAWARLIPAGRGAARPRRGTSLRQVPPRSTCNLPGTAAVVQHLLHETKA